jgi:NADH-quinone oxidoreductase subunit J
VAIVAAVALTLRRRKDSKYFSPSDAVKVKARDRIRIISMKAESNRADVSGKVAEQAEPTQGKAS